MNNQEEKVLIKRSIYERFLKIHKDMNSEILDKKYLRTARKIIKEKCDKTEIRKYYPILSVYEKEHLGKEENEYLKGYIFSLINKLKER
jgi:hypothetical protein